MKTLFACVLLLAVNIHNTLADDPALYDKMVAVADYPARPDLDYVGARISKLLSDNKISSAFPQIAGVSVNVPASQAKKALGILADAVLKEHLPIELVFSAAAGEPSAEQMSHYNQELDSLEKTFVADQNKGDQFGDHFWRESKRIADANGPEIIAAVMLRGRKWKDEEGLIFAPLVDLLPREKALAILHHYEHSKQESDRVWAGEFLDEFDMSDTKEALQRFSK